MSFNTLVQKDAFINKMDKDVSETSKLKLHSSPFNTETLFADKVQPVLFKLDKPVNFHVSVQKALNLTEVQSHKPKPKFKNRYQNRDQQSQKSS